MLDQAKEISADTLPLRIECTFFGRSGKEAWLVPEEQSFSQSFDHRLLSAETYQPEVLQQINPSNGEAEGILGEDQSVLKFRSHVTH